MLYMNEHPEVLEKLMRFAQTGSLDGIPDRMSVRPDLGRNGELPNFNPNDIGRTP